MDLTKNKIHRYKIEKTMSLKWDFAGLVTRLTDER